MTLEILQSRVKEASAHAVVHAQHCEEFITNDNLPEVLTYCKGLSVEPPQFSLTANSTNGDRLRATAKRKLSDPKWWEKKLEEQAIRQYEAEQIAKGNVTQFVSDGLAAYHALGPRGRYWEANYFKKLLLRRFLLVTIMTQHWPQAPIHGGAAPLSLSIMLDWAFYAWKTCRFLYSSSTTN